MTAFHPFRTLVAWVCFRPIADIQARVQTAFMRTLGYVRRMIDREWMKVDWCGSQTLIHRLISATPLAVMGVLGSLLPSRALGVTVVGVGFLAMIAISIWIEGRRLAGTGAFSSGRSDSFVKRIRRRRSRVPDGQNDEQS